MLYLILIVIPAIVGLALGFCLPKVITAIWRQKHRAGMSAKIEEIERRLLCIR